MSTHISAPKSLCGRVVNIVIWESSHWELIQEAKHLFAVGKFIRVRNVKEVSASIMIWTESHYPTISFVLVY